MMQFPTSFEAQVRLLAAKIQPLAEKERRRQIATESGRHGEAVLRAGFQRWQAVKAEDDLADALRQRLDVLDEIGRGRGTNVARSASRGAAS